MIRLVWHLPILVAQSLESPLQEALVRWPVRLAVATYVIRCGVELWATGQGDFARNLRWRELLRGLWTCGCVLYLIHVWAAFAFYHDMSHVEAYRHTAARTEKLTGVDWGGGIYVNYLITIWWCLDVVAWWKLGAGFPYRHAHYLTAMHIGFAFVFFNATVIFGPPVWKYLFGAQVVVLTIWLVRRKALRKRHPKEDHKS